MRSFFVRAFANMICKKISCAAVSRNFPAKNKIHRRAQIESKKDSIFQRLQNILQSAWVSVQAIDMRPKRSNKISYCSKLKNKKRA